LRRPALTIALLVFVGAAVAAGSSQATAPGRNGRVVFRRSGDAVQAIFTIDPDGAGERQVTHPPSRAIDDAPDWSPDGSRIVFRRERGADAAIYTVRPDGSGLTRISGACCAHNYAPAFSPDGRTVAFATFDAGKWTIAGVAPDGGDRRVLVSRGARAALDHPHFSPDGKRLAFVQGNLGRTAPKDGRAVFVVDVDGSSVARVTPWQLRGGGNVDWSPDGRWILFRSNEELDRQSQIYLIHPDGTGLLQLTHFKPAMTVFSLGSFSPDGKWIVFAAGAVGAAPELYLMRSNGSGIHAITHTKLGEFWPDWGPAR
jgi:Tol biopolymer transport system component